MKEGGLQHKDLQILHFGKGDELVRWKDCMNFGSSLPLPEIVALTSCQRSGDDLLYRVELNLEYDRSFLSGLAQFVESEVG